MCKTKPRIDNDSFIKKWCQLMIAVNENVNVHATHMGRLEKSLQDHVQQTDGRFKNQCGRVRSIELAVIPFRLHIHPTPSTKDTTDGKYF